MATQRRSVLSVKKSGAKAKSDELIWVQCQGCSRWEMFENCDLGEVYDKEKVDKSDFECRMCKQDQKISQCLSKIQNLEEKFAELCTRIESTEVKIAEQDKKFGEQNLMLAKKVENETLVELTSKIEVVEKVAQEVTSLVNKKVESDVVELLLNRVEACETAQSEIVVSVSEMKQHSQIKSYAQAVVLGNKERKTSTVNQSFSQKFKEKDNMTVVVVGDSMVRDFGNRLSQNSNMFSSHAFGGAKIENITEVLMKNKVKVQESSHVVV